MKRWLSVFALGCAVVALTFAQTASAREYDSHVYLDNRTTAYVWVTAYLRACPFSTCFTKQLGAWCVPPKTFDKHGIGFSVYEVRAEVSLGGCQHSPVLLNQIRGFPYNKSSSAEHTMTYFVSESNGRYLYGNI